MSFKALKPGKMYKAGPDGELVEVETPPAGVAPLPEDDLPPDMKSSRQEAKDKLDKLTQSMDSLTEQLKAIPEPEEPKIDITISEEDRRNFLRAIISNQPYKKQFKIFDDKITFTLKTLTTAELDAVSEAIVIQSGRIPYSTMLALAGAHMRFCMTVSLCEIQFNDEEKGITKKAYKSTDSMYPDKAKKDTFYVKDANGMVKKEVTVQASPGQKVIWAAQDKFADISVPLYNIIFDKYQKFDSEVLQMTKESADPSFFQTGGVGPSS